MAIHHDEIVIYFETRFDLNRHKIIQLTHLNCLHLTFTVCYTFCKMEL
jgi:hypothetical protein